MATGENKMMRRRLANAYLSSVISISLVLLLVGIASLLLVNAQSVSDYFKENMQILVMMKSEVTDSQTRDYQVKIDEMDCVKSSSFISKEQGENEMKEMLGEDFLSVFETSPIPASIELSLKADYVSADSIEMIRNEIMKSDLVESVDYQQSLIEALNANLAKISVVLGVFIALLLFISFVLINNTVRLNVFSRRFTIHTMKLVGATKAFIRGPFMLQAFFEGLFSAILAIIFLVIGLFIIRSEFAQLFEIFKVDLLLSVMFIVIGAGIVICCLSTRLVVNKLISLHKDELYY